MKKTLLLFTLLLGCMWGAAAQAPTIEGDIMLCPYANGTATITGNTTYDTYQWYFKYWFLEDDFEPIAGATSPSFTYDWDTYDQALLKVVVTQNGQTYESNSIQIDSYAFAGITVIHESNAAVTFNPDTQTFLLCEGGTITNNIGMPYTIVQWYKDGIAIPGATQTSFVITQPGVYYATASPQACTSVTENTLPIAVGINPNCNGGGNETVPPVIAGDTMLCPNTNGTATVTNGQTYDSYQWYVNSFFTEGEFQAIEGATSPSFTYDWYTYDQAQFKLIVIENGQTYESNTITIDSYAFGELTIIQSSNEAVTFDPDTESFLLCEGGAITNTVNMPYTIIQWYKDGVAIPGATQITYVITEPGTYYVSGAPQACPTFIEDNSSQPLVVTENPECNLSVNTPDSNTTIAIYPNPATSIVNISLPVNTTINQYDVIDVTGKTLLSGAVQAADNAITIDSLAQGTYIVKLTGGNTQITKMLIKQ